MNRIYALAVISSFLLSVGCAPADSEIDLEKEAQTIRELSAGAFTAELDRDLDGFMSYFAPDAVIQCGDSPTMDIEAYRVFVAEFFKFPYTDIPLTEPRLIEVAKSGDMAYDVGPWKVVLDGEDGSFELFGKSTIVWRKLNNEWKIVVLSFSNDAPASAPAD